MRIRRSHPNHPGTGRRSLLCLGGGLLLAAAWPVRALVAASGPVVLTVGGRVRMPNQGDAAHFDMTMLAALPQTSFSTRTPWYAQPRRFTGPLLRDVLVAAGAQGDVIRLTALNEVGADPARGLSRPATDSHRTTRPRTSPRAWARIFLLSGSATFCA